MFHCLSDKKILGVHIYREICSRENQFRGNRFVYDKHFVEITFLFGCHFFTLKYFLHYEHMMVPYTLSLSVLLPLQSSGRQLARSESDLECEGVGFQPLRQKAHEKSTPVQSKTKSRDRQIRELQQEMEELQQKQEERDEQIRDLQQQLSDCNSQIREKDAVIAMKLQEIQKLQKEVEQAARARSQQSQQIQQKEHAIQAQERQIRELNQQLVASDYVTMQLQQDLLQKENMIQELQEENQHFQQKLQLETKEEFLQQPLKLSWKTCKAAPYKMYRGSASVHGSKVYLTPAVDSSQIQMYNSDIEEWSTLPECPVCGFTV